VQTEGHQWGIEQGADRVPPVEQRTGADRGAPVGNRKGFRQRGTTEKSNRV
jgi:hypothetical protein